MTASALACGQRVRLLGRLAVAHGSHFYGRLAGAILAPMTLRTVEPLPASAMIAHEHFFSHISLLMRGSENAKESVRPKKNLFFARKKACQACAGFYNAPSNPNRSSFLL